MAYIVLHPDKLRANFHHLDSMFRKAGINWSIVSKVLCGHREFIAELLKLDIKQVCDSRVSNLKTIKQIRPDIETIYLKPPAKLAIPGVVRYADISTNTKIETIRMLSAEARKQGKTHKIIIMIELGELREGIMGDNLVDFYESVFKLDHIEVVGLGTNLSCMYGVLPNSDKLIQLSLYKQLIEEKFKRKIPFVSGGSSVTIPLIQYNRLPKGINHFRVGETLFLGTNVYDGAIYKDMHTDTFSFFTEIIEVMEKPAQPTGDMGSNVEGISLEPVGLTHNETTIRAIVDVGLLDVDTSHMTPCDQTLKIVGASSDMIVVDLGSNPKKYKVGGQLQFNLDYLALLKVMNSRYIEKKIHA